MKYLYIPPTLIVYCLLGMGALFVFLPEFNLMAFPFNLAGLLVAFGGFAIMGKTRDLFKKHTTTLKIEKSTSLISEGLFSKTRNPMYLAMAIMIFGFAIVSTNVLSLLLPFLFLLMTRILFIPKEEALMESTFGDEYLGYKKRVRRWI